MNVTGIIAEYNPFHNGHKYHLLKTKEETGADVVAVVMSGDFVQRGAPAILNKHLRAQWALKNGADIVFELPVVYSLSTAERFAFGGVYLLDAIGCKHISFGTENSLEELRIAYNLYKESSCIYNKTIPFHIQRTSANENLEILKSPNNILAFEYIKALDKLKSSVTPFAIKRNDKGYHSEEIETFSSASAIRGAIKNNIDFSLGVPSEVKNDLFSSSLAFEDAFLPYIKYEILKSDTEKLKNIGEIREGLENRLLSVLKSSEFINYEEFVKEIKSKRYTYSCISRILFQILLSIEKEFFNPSPQYLRLLGANENGFKLLKEIKTLPVINKPSDYSVLTEEGKKMLEKDFLASDVYNLILNKKGKADITTSPCIL
jgi:predicted nucleotidyltransferase